MFGLDQGEAFRILQGHSPREPGQRPPESEGSTTGTAASGLLESRDGWGAAARAAQPETLEIMIMRTPRRSVLGALAAAALCATSRAAPNDDALRSGHGLLERGLYDLAVEEYRLALRDPSSPEARAQAQYGLGVSLLRLGRLEEAVAEIDRLHPPEGFAFAADAAVVRAHALLGLERYEQAGRALATIATDHAAHPSAGPSVALGVEALHRAGDDRAAIALATDHAELVKDAGQRQRMTLFLALSQSRIGQDERAAQSLEPIAADAQAGELGDHAQLRLGQALHRLGRADEAMVWYERAARGRTVATHPEALLGLATLRRSGGDPRGAVEALGTLRERFAQHEPVSVAYELGLARLDLGEHEAALALLDTVADSGDSELGDDAAYWGAKALLRLDRPAQAAQRLAQAQSEHPDSPLAAEVAYDRAVALERAGDLPGADGAFEAFTAAHPEHELAGDALAARASLALARGDAERAGSTADAFLRKYEGHPRTSATRLVRAEALYRTGRTEEAAVQFALLGENEALTQSDRRRAVYRSGMSLWRLGRHEQAEAPLRSVTRGDQTDAEFREGLLALGDGAFAQQRWTEAEDALRAYAHQQDAAGVDSALIQLGLSIARQDRPGEAIEIFARLLDEHPQSVHAPQAIFEIGQAEVELGQDDRARASFERLLAEHPGSRFEPFALRHLGAIAMRSGDAPAAATWLARAGEGGAEAFDAQQLGSITIDRARALLAAGQPAEAAKALASLSPGQRTDAARAWLAVALSRTADHEGAIARAEQVDREELDAELTGLLGYARASSLRALGRGGDAVNAYRVLLAEDPDPSVRAHAAVDLGSLLVEAGDLTEGADLLESVLSSAQVADAALCRAALYQAAWARHALGQHERVVRLLDERSRPCDLAELTTPGELVYGESLLALGQARKAAERLDLVAADADAPELETALLRLGEARAQAQEWAPSRSAFERHRREFADSPQWFRSAFGVGWALENAGQAEDAIEHYRHVTQRHQGETAARAQFQIGQCLFALERHEEAVRELLRVDILYADTPWTPAALFEAGRCFEALGKVGEARERYREVGARFEGSDWARLAAQRLEATTGPATPGRAQGSKP